MRVIRQQRVPASLEVAWTHLTDPGRMRLWFADVDRVEEGEPFRFDFGDGDFFAGTVRKLEQPSLAELEWRFMALGPRYRIRFSLSAVDGSETEIQVIDEGALSEDEAAALDEGWQDFLSRLDRAVRTGESSRYRWSETIAMGATLGGLDGELPPEMLDAEWWRDRFPEAHFEIAGNRGSRLSLRMQRDGAPSPVDEASVSSREVGGNTYLEIEHGGWGGLPEALQLPERRRYANLWQEALGELEGRYGA